jgi:uncharacterized phage protein (TIGR02220 family)
MLNIDDRLLELVDEKELWLMLKIKSFTNAGGEAWPSNETLCRVTGWSKNTLAVVKKRLVKKGLLVIKKRLTTDKSMTSNSYTISTNFIANYVGKQDEPPTPKNGTTPTQNLGIPPTQNLGGGIPKNWGTEVLMNEVLMNLDIMSDSANADDVTPVKVKKEKNAYGSLQPEISEVVAYLNAATGQNMKDDSIRVRPIAARLKDKVSVEDMKAIIDLKVNEWKGTRMAKYLRPETLFNPTKFATYVDELAAAEKKRGVTSEPEHAAFNAMVEKEYPNVWSSGMRMMNEAEWKDYKENITLEGLKIWMRGDKEKVMQKFLKHISKNWELRDKYDNLFSAFRYEIKNRDKW